MRETVGKPKSVILTTLIRAAIYGNPYSTADEIRTKTSLARPKVYDHLKQLNELGLVIISGKRPETKYRTIDKTLIPEQLLKIKEDQIEKKKLKLKEELLSYKSKVTKIKAGFSPSVRKHDELLSHVIRPRDLNNVLSESLRLLNQEDEILCETPNLRYFWTDPYLFNHQDLTEFGNELKSKLDSKNLLSAKYLWRFDPTIPRKQKLKENLLAKVKCIKKSIEQTQNLVILPTNEIYFGSPETTVFGELRVIFSLQNGREKPSPGFMFEGVNAARTFRDRFYRLYQEIKKRTLVFYLDDLVSGQRLHRKPHKDKLEDITRWVREKTGESIDIEHGRWGKVRSSLISNMDVSLETKCLRESTLAQLFKIEQRICRAQ